MQAGGSRTVAIPYNIPEADLAELLPEINGVLLTGGVLELKDKKTGEMHPYYKTAKRIFEYA
jgi:gamma-glutamyl-gamma-aminobutyrate hydrolase PuuD